MNNFFKKRFIAYFTTQIQKNQWTRQLQNIKQKEGESVEDYSRRFRKLLNKATQGNALAVHYQINYYINGLSPLYVNQMVLASPADLNTAVERAKLVETGIKYTMLSSFSKDVPIPIVVATSSQSTPETK